MATEGKYPKFIWVVVATIFSVVVAYALWSGSFVKKIVLPGGEIQFEQKEDQSFNFIVSYDLAKMARQGETTIYIDGQKKVTLYVSTNRDTDTATITLPKPGEYSYRLEQKEIWYVEDDRGEQIPQKYKFTGTGKIAIKRGDGFYISHDYIFYTQTKTRRVEVALRRILTKEEKEEETRMERSSYQ